MSFASRSFASRPAMRRLGAVLATISLVATPLRAVLACEMEASGAPASVPSAGMDDTMMGRLAMDHAAMGHSAPASVALDAAGGGDEPEPARGPVSPDCHRQMGCLVLAEGTRVSLRGLESPPPGSVPSTIAAAPEAPSRVVDPPPPRR